MTVFIPLFVSIFFFFLNLKISDAPVLQTCLLKPFAQTPAIPMLPFNLCPFWSYLRPPLHQLHCIYVSPWVRWERCIDNFLLNCLFQFILQIKIQQWSLQLDWAFQWSRNTTIERKKRLGLFSFYMRLLLNRDLIELQGTIDDNCITTWFLFVIQQRIFIYLIHPLWAPVCHEGSNAGTKGRCRQWGHELKL